MNLNERSFTGTLKDVKVKGEGMDKTCEVKLCLPFRQPQGEDCIPIDMIALSSWVGQEVGILIRGAGRDAQLPLFQDDGAGDAKTLGVKLPKNWEDAAASFAPGVSTETERDDDD